MNKLLTVKEFYDSIAADYDEMVSFDKAVENKKILFAKHLLPKSGTAADIGCGSGTDSIALASLGLSVTAFDPSSEMMKVAKANSRRIKVDVEFNNFAATKIPVKFNKKFDLVVSLGNTFANIPDKLFNSSLKRCYQILQPKGQLIIQILNYDRIFSVKQRIVNITEGLENYFIRFYDFRDGKITFNILRFNKFNTKNFSLTSTRIYPHPRRKFLKQLKASGFKRIEFYSDLRKSPYIKNEAVDLVVFAQRK